MKFETDIYAVAKRLRLEELDERIKHLKSEFEYWRDQYAKHGDHFAQGMHNVSLAMWSDQERLRKHIDQPGVVCYPRQVYGFPTVEM